jgi:hypothetical protein
VPQITIYAAGPSKGSIVEGAYDFCGLSGDQYERTPEEMTKGLRLLNGLMASLLANKGIDLTFDYPSYGEGQLEEPSGIPDGAREAVCALLAQRLAPTIGASLSDDCRAVLASAVQDLLASNAAAPVARTPAYRLSSAGVRHNRFIVLPS